MQTHSNRRKWTALIALVSWSLSGGPTGVVLAAMPLPNTTTVSQTGVLTGTAGGPGDPDLGPDEPGIKPRQPGRPVAVSLTPYSITFDYKDNSSHEQGFIIYRGPTGNGPWTQIAARGPATKNSGGLLRYTDAGLPRDTRYFYRIGAYNQHGESYSVPEGLATIDGRQVSRLRLRIRTANVSDADTDDSVNVALRTGDGGTWLDYGREDFERGDEFTYELQLADADDGTIRDLSEINHIHLLKPDDDGWCIESLALLADTQSGVGQPGVELFSQTFGLTSATCRWLHGSSNYLTIGRDTLRAHTSWQNYQQPFPPLSLDHVDLERRVEGTVGHILHENVWVEFVGPLDVDWSGGPLDGDSFVKVSKRDDQAVQVQFNIDVDVPGPSRLSGSLSFDLRFEGICRNPDASPPLPARLSMKMERAAASADFGGITEALTLWLINFAEGSIADRMVDAFPDFSEDIDIDNEIVDCVTPVVRDNGDVDFEVSLASTPAGGIRGDTSGVLTDSGTSTPPKTVGTIGTVTTGTLAP